jgi:hypothetical protein
MLNFLLLLAKHSEAATSSGGKGMSVEWGIVLGGMVLGVMLALLPPKRSSEVKKSKEE